MSKGVKKGRGSLSTEVSGESIVRLSLTPSSLRSTDAKREWRLRHLGRVSKLFCRWQTVGVVTYKSIFEQRGGLLVSHPSVQRWRCHHLVLEMKKLLGWEIKCPHESYRSPVSFLTVDVGGTTVCHPGATPFKSF